MKTKPLVTIDGIIETARELLRKHWLIRNPIVVGADGLTTIPITRFRDYAGPDLGNRNITCSIYPYVYQDVPTVSTGNAAVLLDDYELAGAVPLSRSRDEAMVNLVVELSMQAYSTVTVKDEELGQEIVTNHPERILRRWCDVIRLIILQDLNKVSGMVTNSSVRFLNFASTNYRDAKGENFVLHRALILWQTCYYPAREWRVAPPVRLKDHLIGVNPDGDPVWWLVDSQVLATGYGEQILRTPTGIPVAWDPENQRFFNPTTDAVISESDLIDPATQLPMVDTDIVVAGYLPEEDSYLYFRKSTEELFKTGDLVVSSLPDGRPLGYEPDDQEFVDPDTGKSYQLRDFLDPVTQTLWLMPDWSVGLSQDVPWTGSEGLVLRTPEV